MMSSLVQKLSDLWDKTRTEQIYQPIDAAHVDDASDYVPVKYGRHYLRLWLAHVYLAKQTQ